MTLDHLGRSDHRLEEFSDFHPHYPHPGKPMQGQFPGFLGIPPLRRCPEAPASSRRPCPSHRSRAIDSHFWVFFSVQFSRFLSHIQRVRSN